MTRSTDGKCTVLAARNVHKAFIYAAALTNIDVEWLYPDTSDSICRCEISPLSLKKAIEALSSPPAAVYVTSPDYLGGTADIKGLAEVCHSHGTLLIVDNAHGAYLHFLREPCHPIDLGADMCCDSAHKTLPVLTGGAYLHISKNAPEELCANAKSAMALFGSTSPSYLTLCSLDMANAYLADGFEKKLADTIERIAEAKEEIIDHGWCVEKSDPLKITLTSPNEMSGADIADSLRESGIECEYADKDFVVFMLTSENGYYDLDKLVTALGECPNEYVDKPILPSVRAKVVKPIGEAMLSPQKTVPTENSVGCICGAPTVSCPPAIPIAVSGEEITSELAALAKAYGINEISVLK